MSLISINSDCLDIFFNSPYENSGKIMLQYEMPTRSPDSEPFSTSYESCSSTLPPTEAFVITVPSAGCSPPLLTELPKNVCPPNCVVCGDLASGYHYDVPSCNGCKTFFRRTLISQTRYRCKKDGNCFAVLPKLKRCSCRACRFQQCVEVGMNPLAINLPEESRSNQLVAEVLGKRKVSREQESSSVETKLVPSRLLSVECLMEKLISSLEYLELKTDKFRKCRYNPNPFELPNLEDLLQQSCSLDIADRVGPMHDWPRPHCVPQLPERSWDPGSRKHWFSFDLLTTIEYAKTFPFLHKLSQADQLNRNRVRFNYKIKPYTQQCRCSKKAGLVEYRQSIVLMQAVALMCLKLTHSFFSYSMKSDQIIHPDGTPIPSPPPPGFERHRQSLDRIRGQSIHLMIRNQITKKEYILMKAMILCNSSVPTLSEEGRKVLESEKQRLSQALLFYCLTEFGSAGPSRYAAAMGVINCLESFTKNEKDIHLLRSMKLPIMTVRFIQQLMD